VVIGWTIIGLCIEAYGFWLLFCEFIPVVLQYSRRIPFLTKLLDIPWLRTVGACYEGNWQVAEVPQQLDVILSGPVAAAACALCRMHVSNMCLLHQFISDMLPFSVDDTNIVLNQSIPVPLPLPRHQLYLAIMGYASVNAADNE
jgi:hypothetical protein